MHISTKRSETNTQEYTDVHKILRSVLAFGLGAYFLDGVAFIKQICKTSVTSS